MRMWTIMTLAVSHCSNILHYDKYQQIYFQDNYTQKPHYCCQYQHNVKYNITQSFHISITWKINIKVNI
jgi:hypothetical protein